MVRDGVLRLLVAPEPVYMQKTIYVCDDGYAGPDGPRKRAMVADLRALGAPATPDAHAFVNMHEASLTALARFENAGIHYCK